MFDMIFMFCTFGGSDYIFFMPDSNLRHIKVTFKGELNLAEQTQGSLSLVLDIII